MKWGITVEHLAMGSGITLLQIYKNTLVQVETIDDKFLPGVNVTAGLTTIQLPSSWPMWVRLLNNDELHVARLLWE